ncbi:hypothetical protein H109_07728 [Trichophyton interdigitale MR816]|uniref:Uncharacterized protein n=1 Tax=Trichophyton interdigitale (strain MR816) TaxID=1215338 RepID=A0A059IY06_TRIIM|nr:hypothetical protein H101_06197 [Trichophyton interdigitale H6]KDB20318.1 hypothetical protein H109_07728 [Trichophyton interdigitale MR816]
MHGQPIPQSGSLPSIDSFMDLSSPKSPPIGLGQSAFSPGQKPGRPQADSPPPHAQGSPSNQRTQQRIQGISTVQPKYFPFPNVNPNGPKALRQYLSQITSDEHTTIKDHIRPGFKMYPWHQRHINNIEHDINLR